MKPSTRNTCHTNWAMAALLTAVLIGAPALVSAGSQYSIEHWTIAGGGIIEAEGGDWMLSGTIGQWEATEARALTGDQWQLTGGFWGMTLEELAEFIFRDRFEDDWDPEPESVSDDGNPDA